MHGAVNRLAQQIRFVTKTSPLRKFVQGTIVGSSYNFPSERCSGTLSRLVYASDIKAAYLQVCACNRSQGRLEPQH